MGMEQTKEVKIKTKKKLSKSGLILIIGLAIIIIPCLVFGSILVISKIQSGSPREGTRFKNDLVNEITNDDVSTIKTNLSSLTNVENVDVVIVSQGQLKIYIDAKDSATSDDVDALIASAYEKVIAKLPIATYFTRTDSAKMYDLEINVYTTLEKTDSRQYKVLHKNSAEETFGIDDMVTPKDPELVEQLENGITNKQAEEQANKDAEEGDEE